MISSKFTHNARPVLLLRNIQIVSKFPPVLSLFFDISDELVYLKIEQVHEARMPETTKVKKGHSRKNEYVHKREKSEAIINLIQKSKNIQELVPLYEHILNYIETFTMLKQSYLGLRFVDFIDYPQERQELEKEENRFSSNNCLYFLLKLSSTFYMARGTIN